MRLLLLLQFYWCYYYGGVGLIHFSGHFNSSVKSNIFSRRTPLASRSSFSTAHTFRFCGKVILRHPDKRRDSFALAWPFLSVGASESRAPYSPPLSCVCMSAHMRDAKCFLWLQINMRLLMVEANKIDEINWIELQKVGALKICPLTVCECLRGECAVCERCVRENAVRPLAVTANPPSDNANNNDNINENKTNHCANKRHEKLLLKSFALNCVVLAMHARHALNRSLLSRAHAYAAKYHRKKNPYDLPMAPCPHLETENLEKIFGRFHIYFIYSFEHFSCLSLLLVLLFLSRFVRQFESFVLPLWKTNDRSNTHKKSSNADEWI